MMFMNLPATGRFKTHLGSVGCKMLKRICSPGPLWFPHKHLKRLIFSWTSLDTMNKTPYSVVHPGRVSPVLSVPSHIQRPPYVTEKKYPTLSEIEVKSKEQVEGMRHACRMARTVLNTAASHLKIGITTDEIDKIVHQTCTNNNCYPSPLQYKGFPKSVCTSVNNVAVHGIPDDRALKDGDVINIDVTVYTGGFHGDCSETYTVGEVDKRGRDLIRLTKYCRDEAIKLCGPGVDFAEIGNEISKILRGGNKFAVMPNLCGHGIGSYFHGPPDVIHCAYTPEKKQVMAPGMTFTIEPCLSEGADTYKILDDGWTAVTVDDSRTAQFEHTVLITLTGVEVLT
ncbi:methionine aminopeptidase 1D, mitochondrial-like [Lineus longissimus]|uniref:methionine aminopeptidase 1D, mitochondrial-like n=1 Tax=Lineus longissimus TaxID=88925 RepID=UPI002B4F3C7E